MIYIKHGAMQWSTVAYTVDGDYIRDAYGNTVYYIYGRYIYRGNNPNGEIVYNIDGNYIREGNNPLNTVKYYIDNDQVRDGMYSWSTIVYTIVR